MSGESIGYFDFFPLASKAHGAVPTWGIARIVESTVHKLPVGTRVYGLVPMGPGFVAYPAAVTSHEFRCAAPHRAKRDAVYNTYTLLDADPLYAGAALENEMILYRPLFLTAFLLRQVVLGDAAASLVVITSASSKTAVCLATLLQSAPSRPKVVGLTSQRNLAFCQASGAFDALYTYDGFASALDLSASYTVVDFACDDGVLRALQRPSLLRMSVIGATHQGKLNSVLQGHGFDPALVRPTFFFAPKAAVAIIKRLGQDEFQKQVFTDFHRVLGALKVNVATARTAAELLEGYRGYVRGSIPAEQSWVAVFNGVAAAL